MTLRHPCFVPSALLLVAAAGAIGAFWVLRPPELSPPRALWEIVPVSGPLHLFAEEVGLDVHYVALSADDAQSPVDVQLGGLTDPHIVVLASEAAITWRLQGADPDLLRTVIVHGPDHARIAGVPAELQVWRSTLNEELDDLIAPVCIGGKRYDTSCRHGEGGGTAMFARIDGLIADLTGHHIASLAGARHATEFRLPGLPITPQFRQALQIEAESETSLETRRQRIAERNRGYERRFEAELQEELASLLNRHPPLDFAALPPRTTRVALVAIYGGLDRGYRRHREFLTYGVFAANARKRRENVLTQIATGEPTLLLLLSPEPVAWEIQALGTTELTGVAVASREISTVEGLADRVPLEIGSRATGNLPAWFSFGTPEARAELEAFLARTFPTTPATVEIRRARLGSLVIR